MKPASLKNLKIALNGNSRQELMDICLVLAKSRKENKELLSYLLFESKNEENFIEETKKMQDEEFSKMNTSSYYFMKKTCRKILKLVKKYIRFSTQKETEVELLLYFCFKMKELSPDISGNTVLWKLWNRQIDFIEKKLAVLHPDLQYDYQTDLQILKS